MYYLTCLSSAISFRDADEDSSPGTLIAALFPPSNWDLKTLPGTALSNQNKTPAKGSTANECGPSRPSPCTTT